AELERSLEVGFQPVPLPDSPDCRFAQPARPSHCASAPMCRVRWLFLGSHAYHPLHCLRGDLRLPTWPWSILLNPFDTEQKKPPTPSTHTLSRYFQLFCNQ